jgi:hypothetical protein
VNARLLAAYHFALIMSAWCSTAVHADAKAWSLQWSAPAGCPTQAVVRQTIEIWLAQAIEPNDPSGIAVEARVQREPQGFVLALMLETPSGQAEEKLVAERCETLAGVVALKVALAADPGAWFEAAREEERRRWGVRLAAGVSQGLQPGAGPQLALTGFYRFTYVQLELGAGYGLPNEARYRDRPAIGASLDTLHAIARACALPDMGAVEFPICAGVDAGVMRGAGFGLRQTTTSVQPMLTLVVGPALRVPLGERVNAWFGLEALVPLVRPEYHVRNLDRLFVSERIAARVQLGAELNF